MTRRVFAVAAVVLVLLSAVSGVVAAAPGDTDTAVQPAQLDIEQPSWVEEPVRSADTANGSVYVVIGNEFEISVLNIDRSNVVRAGVRENSGRMSYDARDDEYIFTPSGTNGTYTLYWVVERPVKSASSGNSTPGNATGNGTAAGRGDSGAGDGTVTVTYAAQVRVTHASFVHEPSAEDSAEERKAGYWSQVKRMVAGIDGVESSAKAVLTAIEKTGVPWIKFVHNPLAEFGGTFTAVVSILIFRPGGWFLTALFVAVILVVLGGALYYRTQARSDLPFTEDVERKEQDLWSEKRRRILKNADYVDDIGLTERWATAFRSHGMQNPYKAAKRVFGALTRAELRAMGACAMQKHHSQDYRVVADDESDPTTADLIDVSTDDSEGDVAEWAAVWHPSNAPAKAYNALTWDPIDWDALARGVDLGDVPVNLVSEQYGDADDLITRLGIDLRKGFNESPEDFAEGVAALVQGVAAHNHIVEGGEDPARDIVAALYTFTEAAGDRYEVPYARYVRDALLAVAEGMDADTATRQYIADSRARGIDDAIASAADGGDVPSDVLPDSATDSGGSGGESDDG